MVILLRDIIANTTSRAIVQFESAFSELQKGMVKSENSIQKGLTGIYTLALFNRVSPELNRNDLPYGVAPLCNQLMKCEDIYNLLECGMIVIHGMSKCIDSGSELKECIMQSIPESCRTVRITASFRGINDLYGSILPSYNNDARFIESSARLQELIDSIEQVKEQEEVNQILNRLNDDVDKHMVTIKHFLKNINILSRGSVMPQNEKRNKKTSICLLCIYSKYYEV